MKRLYTFLILLCVIAPKISLADEGMWLPMFLQKLNYADMQGKGLKLTPEEIYHVNNSSLKDAIVRLGGGFCSGEMISKEGLFLTNHHCGYSVIQANSSVEHDYLKDGFWAMTREEELPAEFSVSYLVRMEDVSKRINGDLTDDMSEMDRAKKVSELKKEIIAEMNEKDESLDYEIKGFFKGNEFYMLVYNTYDDVRLVGAPPSSIGKYGGDTDNWMWPRHTGDFTMFRVYADKDNNPAEYSKDNVPYQPKHHLPISMKGVQQGDYAMIFGYPGSTDRYLTSYGVKLATEKDQPARVKIRRKKLDIYEAEQAKSDKVRIQYASKHAGVSNYWKYFIGQTKGLKRLNVYGKKKAQEDAFMYWVKADPKRTERYGEVMKTYEEAYAQFEKGTLAQTYLFEAIFGTEIIRHGFSYLRLKGILEQLEFYKSGKFKKEDSFKTLSKADQATEIAGLPDKIKGLEGQRDGLVAGLRGAAKGYHKDYSPVIDQQVLVAMLQMYDKDLPDSDKPQEFNELMDKYKNGYMGLGLEVFENSFMTSEAKENAFLDNPSLKAMNKDKGVQLSEMFLGFYRAVIPGKVQKANLLKEKADRLYVEGLRKMNPDKSYYPDANSTMRVTYGNVLNYKPQDAVRYDHFTTLAGVVEKFDPSNPDFELPERLIELYNKKDYGKYADKDGSLHTCFISNNDITGGNSGSGVINGNGELIGTAFDGNWEAMSGDIAFEPQLQRTISVDIRYTLFIIDKYAGASHLIEEMDLVWEDKK